MCQGTAYLVVGGEKEKVMSEIAWLEPTAEGIRLVRLFGEAQTVAGRLVGVDFLRATILIEPETGSSGPRASGLRPAEEER